MGHWENSNLVVVYKGGQGKKWIIFHWDQIEAIYVYLSEKIRDRWSIKVEVEHSILWCMISPPQNKSLISLWFLGELIYHPQPTNMVQPRFYKKMINCNYDIRYWFRTTTGCRMLKFRPVRVQHVFFSLVESNVLKKNKKLETFPI